MSNLAVVQSNNFVSEGMQKRSQKFMVMKIEVLEGSNMWWIFWWNYYSCQSSPENSLMI